MNAATLRHPVANRLHRRTVALLLSASLAAAAAALLAIPAAHAAKRVVLPLPPPVVEQASRVVDNPIEVEVRVAGRRTPLYHSAARPDRWYLQAREGANYEVRVRNRTGERVAFVISVDGLNAINGERTTLSARDPMYVLEPYGRTTVKGWRKDMRNVSRFVFVDEERSYAERTGQGNGDLGWIRVLAFREAEAIAWGGPSVRYRTNAAPPAPVSPESAPRTEPKAADESRTDGGSLREQAGRSAPQSVEPQGAAPDAPAPESSPGTGWGRNERDRARWVDFTPERFACAQVILRYEYPAALVALGILPVRAWQADRLWERENGQYGFAQPPAH